jgi:hypothetical protein
MDKVQKYNSFSGIELGYELDDRGVRVPKGSGNFSPHHGVIPALVPNQPLIQWVPGALSPGVKRPGREADQSHSYNAKVKKARSYTSTSQYAFMAWCSVKAQGQLYLYL